MSKVTVVGAGDHGHHAAERREQKPPEHSSGREDVQ